MKPYASAAAAVAALSLSAGAAMAQSGPAAVQPGEAVASAPTAPDPPQKSCPPEGYAAPVYATFGDNDGLVRAYEIASPCVGPEVRDIARSIGMVRIRPMGLKTMTTLHFSATGAIADAKGRMVEAKAVEVSMNFITPAMRIEIEGRAAGKPVREVRVFADELAWDETAPGIGGKETKGALKDRAPLIKLNPFGAAWSLIEAEGHVKVSKAGAANVVSGASPFDGYEVTVTTDAEQRPVRVLVRAQGATYEATFDGYADTWESPYLFVFPAHMVWLKNGKPLADLKVTAFHSNPYVVFPTPATMKAAAAASATAQKDGE